MKIVQVSHALTYGDAASNQVISLDRLFKKMNFRSAIYAGKIDSALEYPVSKYSGLRFSKDTLLIYHFSTGTSFVNQILKYPYPIVLYYHNITPARYFFGNAWGSFIASIKGRQQLKKLKDKAFFAWAASEYSRQELEEYGFKNSSVLPILVDFESYKRAQTNEELKERYSDSINLLCVGRVTPHKKQEDAIRTLYYYKNFINKNVKLFIVGGAKHSYLAELKKLAQTLKIERDVVFTGKISFDDLCTYYRISDAFLSMSEHEGFCVPLIESMLFKKPVFAYDETAIPYTLNNSGVRFDGKNPAILAEFIHYVISNENIQHKIIKAQDEQLNQFSYSSITNKVSKDINIIKNMI